MQVPVAFVVVFLFPQLGLGLLELDRDHLVVELCQYGPRLDEIALFHIELLYDSADLGDDSRLLLGLDRSRAREVRRDVSGPDRADLYRHDRFLFIFAVLLRLRLPAAAVRRYSQYDQCDQSRQELS